MLEETISSFERLVAGEFDNLPEQAFFMAGGIDDVVANAKKLQGRRAIMLNVSVISPEAVLYEGQTIRRRPGARRRGRYSHGSRADDGAARQGRARLGARRPQFKSRRISQVVDNTVRVVTERRRRREVAQYTLVLSAFCATAPPACSAMVMAPASPRVSRVKGDEHFPTGAVAFCLAEAGIRRTGSIWWPSTTSHCELDGLLDVPVAGRAA